MRRNKEATFLDLQDEMRRTPVDQATIDRLMSGAIAPEDAPPELAGVAALFWAAGRLPNFTSPREAETVTAMAAIVRERPWARLVKEKSMRRFLKIKIAAAAAGATVIATAGLAFAGALPDAAQNGIATAFEKAGITIPNSNSEDAGQPADPGGNAGENSESADVHDAIDGTDPGVERGAAVSDAASDGKSNVPESVPVGENAGDGANQTGVETSTDASDGKSRAGEEHGESGSHP